METTTLAPTLVAALRAAADIETIGRIVRTAARELVHADGATFVLSDGPYCFYEDEDAIAPLWKGQRFPKDHCVSGWAMTNGEAALISDIRRDTRVPLDAYAPTFVKSMAMVPVGRPAVAAIGTYWAQVRQTTWSEVGALEELAAAVAEALQRVGMDSAPWAPNFAL